MTYGAIQKKAADFSAAFSRHALAVCSVGADSDANTGRADADAATFLIAALLDITLARGISVPITGLTHNNAAFTTFTPTATILVANDVDVLNVAVRHD